MRSFVLAITLSLAVSGCDDGPHDPDATLPVGTYVLSTINGESLPFALGVYDGYFFEALTGHVVLNADRTASYAYVYRLTQGEVTLIETQNDHGTYVKEGSSVIAHWAGGLVQTFAHAGNELQLIEGGLVLGFRK